MLIFFFFFFFNAIEQSKVARYEIRFEIHTLRSCFHDKHSQVNILNTILQLQVMYGKRILYLESSHIFGGLKVFSVIQVVTSLFLYSALCLDVLGILIVWSACTHVPCSML